MCIAIDDGPARWDFWHTEIVHIPTLQHLPHYYTAQLFQAVSNCNLGLLHQTYITPCLTPLLECTHIWCRRLLRSRRAWRFAIFPILLLVIFLLSNFLVGNPPPPPGGFPFLLVSKWCSRRKRSGPLSKDCAFENHSKRKPPRGVEVSSDQLDYTFSTWLL